MNWIFEVLTTTFTDKKHKIKMNCVTTSFSFCFKLDAPVSAVFFFAPPFDYFSSILNSCPHTFIQGLSCPLGADDGQRRFCTAREETTSGSSIAWRPWKPCDQPTSKASRQEHNPCLTRRLRSRPSTLRAQRVQKSRKSPGLPAAFWLSPFFFTPLLSCAKHGVMEREVNAVV